jgi:hypothetical protein
MVSMLFVDRVFDVNVHDAYANFTHTANAWLLEQQVRACAHRHDCLFQLDIKRAPHSSVFLYLIFSVLFAFLAGMCIRCCCVLQHVTPFTGMLAFPAFRYSKMYWDGVQSDSVNVFTKLLIHMNFFAPLLLLLLWTRPISEHLVARTVVTVEQLDSLRLTCAWALVAMRLAMARTSIQVGRVYAIRTHKHMPSRTWTWPTNA